MKAAARIEQLSNLISVKQGRVIVTSMTKAPEFGKRRTPPVDRVEAVGAVLREELGMLLEHVTQGTDYEVHLVAIAVDSRTGRGRVVVKGNIRTRRAALTVVGELGTRAAKWRKELK